MFVSDNVAQSSFLFIMIIIYFSISIQFLPMVFSSFSPDYFIPGTLNKNAVARPARSVCGSDKPQHRAEFSPAGYNPALPIHTWVRTGAYSAYTIRESCPASPPMRSPKSRDQSFSWYQSTKGTSRVYNSRRSCPVVFALSSHFLLIKKQTQLYFSLLQA